MKRLRQAATILALSTVCLAQGVDDPGPPPSAKAVLEVVPVRANVGDLLEATLVVDLPPGTRLDPPSLGPTLGPLSVEESSWSGPETTEAGLRWTWHGKLLSFRTGEMEVPAISVEVTGEDGSRVSVETSPLTITIESVLRPEEEEGGDLADIKPPASLAPDYGPLLTAAAILGLLLVAAGLLWWLHRRYASRLAAVAAPDDPFHRTPPHVWVYGELQALLGKRLVEQGEFVRFFAELSWILKRYLGGRYRVDLMERTSSEVPELLGLAGASDVAIRAISELLARCDGAKFARRIPDSEGCRSAIEEAYRIVDETKPRDSAVQEPEEGAA